MSDAPTAVGLSASPNRGSSQSGALLDIALLLLRAGGVRVERHDLTALPADGLLGRVRAARVDAVVDALLAADLVVVATPIYRATYSGLLKVFFDLLPNAALVGKVAVPIASGGSLGHQLAIDHGLRPLLGSLGASVVATGVYATPQQFSNGSPEAPVIERVERSVAEALSISRGYGARSRPVPALTSPER